MFKKSLGTIALAVAMLMIVPTNAYAIDNQIAGSLVADVPHELPAPVVAVNDDGVSLVVWNGQDPAVTDADPVESGNQVCDGNGDYCDLVYALVDADGQVLGDPVGLVTDSDYYYAAPSVSWNADLGEWLVLMTNGDGPDVFAARIDSDGSQIGSTALLPADQVTPFDDRTAGAIVVLSGHNDTVKPYGQWSSEEQAYFVSWYSEASNIPYGAGGSGNAAAFGVFLNSDLTVKDGIDAAFVVSWGQTINCCQLSLGFSEERSEWIVTWQSNANDFEYAIVSNPSAPAVAEEGILVDESSYTVASGGNRGFGGDFEWVPSEGKWFFTWAMKVTELNDGNWGVFGQWLSPDGTLSSVQVVDGGSEIFLDAQAADAEVEVEADRVVKQDVEYDPSAKLVHVVFTKQFRNVPDSQDEDTETQSYSLHAFYTIYDPVAEEVVEENVLTEEFPLESSRPVIDLSPGGLAIAYQDWSNGDWADPSEVRLHQGAGYVLADTGANVDGLALAGLFAVVAGAGVYAVRRRANA